MSDWIDEIFDDLEEGNYSVSFGKRTFIDALIRTCIFDETAKMRIELELTQDMQNDRANDIILDLLDNQMSIHDMGDYRQKSIKKHLDNIFGCI